MKKLLAALAALLMTCALFAPACDTSSEDEKDGSQNNVQEEGYGTLKISDTYAWLDYPATEFNLCYSNPAKAETLTYEYDNTALAVDTQKHTVSALKAGTYPVKAKSENFEASFNVICEEVDRTDNAFSLYSHDNGDRKYWDVRANNFKNDWRENGNNGYTTVFIGDSFFDQTGFWKTFYDDYAGKDALCWGIGSTTTYTWETMVDELLADTMPKNLVMHCGTNSVYDLTRSANDVVSSIERMFTLMHDALPRTQIYYFTITHRYYQGASERQPVVDEVNSRVTEWAQGRDWLTVIDTCSKFKFDMIMSDGIHPNADGYKLFMEELAKTDIVIRDLK